MIVTALRRGSPLSKMAIQGGHAPLPMSADIYTIYIIYIIYRYKGIFIQTNISGPRQQTNRFVWAGERHETFSSSTKRRGKGFFNRSIKKGRIPNVFVQGWDSINEIRDEYTPLFTMQIRSL